MRRPPVGPALTRAETRRTTMATTMVSADGFYRLGDAYIERIASMSNLPAEQVREVVLTRWNEGEEQQRWLYKATVPEIADWVLTVLEQA